MLNTTKTVRYTATLPSDYIDELKQLAKAQQIPSVKDGGLISVVTLSYRVYLSQMQ